MKYKNKRRLILGISILLLVFFYVFKNYSSFSRAGSFILGLLIFYFWDHAFQVHLKFRHYLYIIFILFCGMLLAPLYYTYDIYDKILHFTMPILASFIVFFMVNQLKIDFKYKLLITLTSVVTILVILEIGEYLFDQFWNLKLQGVYLRDSSGLTKYQLVLDRNDDTMIDLILGFLGSLIFVIGKSLTHIFHKRYGKKSKLTIF